MFSFFIISCAKVPQELEVQPVKEIKEAPIEIISEEIPEAKEMPEIEEKMFCATDVKECPDGSFVARMPPSCEFSSCPEIKAVKKTEEVKEVKVEYASEMRETILKEGNFRRGTASARGMAQVIERDQKYYVKLSQLNIEKGNQLFVYLAKESSPRLPTDLYYKGYLNLGSLKLLTEDQEYFIPIKDIKDYNSIVIYENIGDKIHAVAELK